MKEELISFISTHGLSPFSSTKTPLKLSMESPYKTKDARAVHTKLLATLSTPFQFAETANLFSFFEYTDSPEVIVQRQAFFKSIGSIVHHAVLKTIVKPKPFWNPDYGIIVVTEDEKTLAELKRLSCPVQFLITEHDLEGLGEYDIVQVIDCEQFSRALEQLPQAVFLDSLDEVYLERHVRELSGWKAIIETLAQQPTIPEIDSIVHELLPLLSLTLPMSATALTRESLERRVETLNEELAQSLKEYTLSGESLVLMLSKSKLPDDILTLCKQAIAQSGVPSELIRIGIPLTLDDDAVTKLLRKQELMKYSSAAETITFKARELKTAMNQLSKLERLLVFFDFIGGLFTYIRSTDSYPLVSSELEIVDSRNVFLENAQPIRFSLTPETCCSILTGANSGGKTTLLEHTIQLIGIQQLGLPVRGQFSAPLFRDVYYFAKNKGSLNKGAFETLLQQLSTITPSPETLILADEIESVTEPGVAGAIVAASAEFFSTRGCFLIIATHLGKHIQNHLPTQARIDGIEAKGLTDSFELIIDHNPVLGKLANSTPELIIEKMARTENKEYFTFLFESLRR